MIKQAPTLPKLLVMIAFALCSFGALLFLWVSFGGGVPGRAQGYRFGVDIPQAAQLTRQADVRISGVNVGKVVALTPQRNTTTRVTIQLDAKYAPIPRAATATLRAKTLLGETYVELAPHRDAGTGPLPEGGTLAADAARPTVELDDVLKAFDPRTRAAFRTWQETQARSLEGRGADLNAAFGELPLLVEEVDHLAATLDAQGSAVKQAVSGTATVFDAISRRRGDLRRLVTSGDRAFAAIGERNRALAAIFRALPAFEREATATLPAVTALGDRGLPVVRRLQPVATRLAPTLDAADRLSPDLAALMTRLGPVVTASQQGLPAFVRTLDRLPSLLTALTPPTRTINPALRQLSVGKRELTSFLGNVTAATNARDRGTGARYVRAAVNYSPQGLAFQSRLLGQTRRNAYPAPGSGGSLLSGLSVLGSCATGDPASPTDVEAPVLERLLTNVFQTTTRDVARPGCRAQGAFPGFSTAFPQLGADPAAALAAGARR
ncbi:MlaD family protein [Patulibacter minatonensis]|uniref:MlaD family protein n=1 Tax=Patulibacter minatonensis TaxID=298163 RepID=UPI00047C069F|nr:MlaD family protein [Patulibacter minatonensis]